MIDYNFFKDSKARIDFTTAEREQVTLLKKLYQKGARRLVYREPRNGLCEQLEAYSINAMGATGCPIAIIKGSTVEFVLHFSNFDFINEGDYINLEDILEQFGDE